MNRVDAVVRRRVWTGIKAIVSIALLTWVVRAAVEREGADALWTRATGLDPWWLVGAVALQVVSVFAGIVRWKLLLEDRGLALRLPWLTRSYFIGRFLGTLTPSTMGLDLYRIVAVARVTGDKARSVGAIFLEKLLGLLALAFTGASVLWLTHETWFSDGAPLVLVLTAVGACVCLLILFKPRLLERITPRVLRARAPGLFATLTGHPLSPRVAAVSMLLGIASHLATGATFVAAARALGVGVPPLDMLAVGVAIVVATLLPVSISGVGVREGVAVLLLSRAAVSPADAVIVALLGYLSAQPPSLLGGLLTFGPTVRHSPADKNPLTACSVATQVGVEP